MIEREAYVAEMEARGCFLVEGLLDASLLERCRSGLEEAMAAEARFHGSTEYADRGMVQCCPMYDRVSSLIRGELSGDGEREQHMRLAKRTRGRRCIHLDRAVNVSAAV